LKTNTSYLFFSPVFEWFEILQLQGFWALQMRHNQATSAHFPAFLETRLQQRSSLLSFNGLKNLTK